jgi:hypothetical protein
LQSIGVHQMFLNVATFTSSVTNGSISSTKTKNFGAPSINKIQSESFFVPVSVVRINETKKV